MQKKKRNLITILLSCVFLTSFLLNANDIAISRQAALNNEAAAIEAFMKALRLLERSPIEDEDGAESHAILNEAASAFKKFIADFPQAREMPEAMRLLGKIYVRQEKHDDAIAHFNQVMQQYPNHPASAYCRYDIGNSLFEQKKYDEAIAQFQTVINAKTDKKNVKDKVTRFVPIAEDYLRPFAQYGIAQCYLKQGKKAEAQKAIETLIATYPDRIMTKIIAKQSKLMNSLSTKEK